MTGVFVMVESIEILIPSFNRPILLFEAVSSALSQDYPHLSVIVSDNHSEFDVDGVLGRLSEDARLKIFKNEVNLGMRGNWHTLLYNLASAKWVMILNDDDILLDPGYITKVMKLAANHKSIALIWSNYSIFNEVNGSITSTNYELPPIVSGKEYFAGYQKQYPHIHSTMSVVFRRQLAINVGAFQTDILGLDTELWLKLMKEGDVGFIGDVSSMYRVHPANQQTTNLNLERDIENARCLKNVVASYRGELSFEDLQDVERRIIESFFWWRLNQLSKSRERNKVTSYISTFVKSFPYLKSSFASRNGIRFIAKRLLSFFGR